MGTPVYLFGQKREQQPSLIDSILGRFMAGMQIGQTIRAANQEAETRKLNMEVLRHQLNAMKLAEKLEPIKQQLSIAQLLQGMPGQQMPSSLTPQPVPVPGLANAPESIGGPGGTQPSDLTTTFGLQPSTVGVEAPNAPVSIDLSGVFPGRGKMDIPILNREQMQNQTLQETLARLGIEARGEAMKAGAKAKAEFPFQAELESRKAETAEEAAIRASQREFEKTRFVQGEENKRNQTTAGSRIGAAQITAAAQKDATRFNRSQKLSEDYRTQVKRFDEVSQKIDQAEALAADPNPSGQNDMALVFTFMKVLDEGVVRETEYARAAQIGSLKERAKAQLAKLEKGELLTPAQRAAYVHTMRTVGDSVQKYRGKVDKDFTQKANRWGLDPSDVLSSTPSPSTVSGLIATNPTTGEKIQWDGTKWVPVQ